MIPKLLQHGCIAPRAGKLTQHQSILGDFPGAPQFAEEIRELGFIDVAYERLSFGIVAIHIARKPAQGV